MRRKIGLFFAGCMFSLLLTVPVSGIEAATVYTVQKGDSLYLIGQKFGVSAAQIQQANGLSSSMIYPGQKLSIPGTSSSSGVYTVQKGDSLYLIGKKYGLSYQEIMRANNLNSTLIYPGQQLRIPAGTTADRGAVNRTASAPANVAANEFELLARLINAEAGGEPYTAQVAVGAVVLNRVSHPSFPNSISEVIYQKSDGFYQFTPVQNGYINVPPTDSARRAAQDAINGWDPTNGAIYFFESDVTNKWLQSRPFAAKIGAFTFTY